MKNYTGTRLLRGGCQVTVTDEDGYSAPLATRLDLWNHSPTGFEWGYGGSGPAQLALAILADCCGDDLALRLHKRFKRDVIAGLPSMEWRLTQDQVLSWVGENRVSLSIEK